MPTPSPRSSAPGPAVWIAMALAAALAGCAAAIQRNAVPTQALAQNATVPDLTGIRAWADEVPADAAAEVRRRAPRRARCGRGGGGGT